MNRYAILTSILLGYGLLLLPDGVQGQETSISDPTPSTSVAAPPCEHCAVVPAMTAIKLEILAVLGSNISKTGDQFPIRLAQDILIEGKVAIPAGATGIGEVVHAKKSGGSGSAGELVLAARYLDVAGQRLLLRSMRLTTSAESKINTVNNINVASAAAGGIPISLVGFFINGGQANVPQGTIADAKTAAAFSLPSP